MLQVATSDHFVIDPRNHLFNDHALALRQQQNAGSHKDQRRPDKHPFLNIFLLCSFGILAPRFQWKQYVSDGLCEALITAFQGDRQDAAGIKSRALLLSHQTHQSFWAAAGWSGWNLMATSFAAAIHR